MFVRILLILLFVGCAYAPVAAIAAENPAVASAARSTPVAVGETAPDFTLEDQDGQSHTLSAERVKRAIVLVFFRGHW